MKVEMPVNLEGPTLSIVMANYNKGPFVAEAIESVLQQGRRADEFIIVDDGSTDESVEVVASYARKYPELIRFVSLKGNMGMFYAFDLGLAAASGRYVMLSGSDDKYLPGFFERSMEMLSRFPQAGLCTALEVAIDAQGREIASHRTRKLHRPAGYLSAPAVRSLLERDDIFINSVATVIRREAFVGHAAIRDGFFTAGVGDLLPLCALAALHGACYIPEKLACWRVMERNYSQKRRDVREALSTIERKRTFMRAPGMKELFPERFVQRQIDEQVLVVALGACASGSRLEQFLAEVSSIVSYRRTRSRRLLLAVLRAQVRLLTFVCRAYFAMALAPARFWAKRVGVTWRPWLRAGRMRARVARAPREMN